ncbi:MAG: MFS transporter [Phototrophicaceae bacterium]
MTSSTKNKRSFSLLPQVTMLTLTRMVINTGVRMVYPLLPVFARGLGVDVASFAIILTIMQLTGITAPIFGQLSERQGRRFTMLLGLGAYGAGIALVFIYPSYIGFAAALIVASLGKVAYDPALQAYIGDRVPYEKRGLFMGIIEFGWSGAFIIGVPIMSWLIAGANWQIPFVALTILTGVAWLTTFIMLDKDKPSERPQGSFLQGVRAAINSPIAVAGLLLGFGISGANQMVTVVFGLWIENSFGIQLAALAAASAVIGISELGGEGIVTIIADRFGKRRLIIISIIGNMLVCLVLPFMNASLTVALIGLFFFYLTFETALVASIPLASELSPKARGMYLTVFVSAITIGRTIATPLSTIAFTYGLLTNTIGAIIFNIIALIAVWRYIRIE